VSTARKESDRAECERKLDQALELTFATKAMVLNAAADDAAIKIAVQSRKHRRARARPKLYVFQVRSRWRSPAADRPARRFQRPDGPLI
jgi:hypothetical protein